MLLNGIKGTKKRFLLVILSLLVLLGVCYIGLRIFVKQNANTDVDVYYDKMMSLIETSEKIYVKNIFELDFDKAYVANEVYGDEKYFLEKLGVASDISIPTLESGGHYRILFIKDNRIVYDFVYEITEINIRETGIYIFPNTIVELEKQNSVNCGKTIIQMEFDA